MTEKNATELGKAIWHWLEFQVVCCREWMLSEKSLAQPIGEYLHSVKNITIETESGHPELEKKQKGRGRQIDYVMKKSNGTITGFIESKWVSSNPDIQGIVNDILRLERIKNSTNNYFVLAGLKNDFEQFFKKGFNFNGKKIQSVDYILPFQSGLKENMKIESCPEELRRLFIGFAEDYGIEVPKSLDRKLVFGNLNAHESTSTYVFIWRVKSASNRKTFAPLKAWSKENQPNNSENID